MGAVQSVLDEFSAPVPTATPTPPVAARTAARPAPLAPHHARYLETFLRERPVVTEQFAIFATYNGNTLVKSKLDDVSNVELRVEGALKRASIHPSNALISLTCGFHVFLLASEPFEIMLECKDVLKAEGSSITFIASTLTVAVGSRDGSILLYDFEARRTLQQRHIHSDSVRELKYMPRSHQLISTSWDQTVRIVDASDLTLVQEFKGLTHFGVGLAFLANEDNFLSVDFNAVASHWRRGQELPIRSTARMNGGITADCLALLESANLFAVGFSNGMIHIRHIDSFDLAHSFSVKYHVGSLQFSWIPRELAVGKFSCWCIGRRRPFFFETRRRYWCFSCRCCSCRCFCCRCCSPGCLL
eukprot:m.236644 g.236644  ORF g.236644 m.236644 type:complete len:359 (-) comp54328_c0_seq2:102-1178(-)